MKQPTAYFLIGLPGAGKSTFRAKLEAEHPGIVAISTDDTIERLARLRGVTYSEMFPAVDMKTLEAEALATANRSFRSNVSVIVDRTNLRRESRRRFMDMMKPRPDDAVAIYGRRVLPVMRFVGVVFHVPEDLHRERLERRAEATGKAIPWQVIEAMKAGYEPPAVGEFDTVLVVDPWTGEASAMEDLF